MHIPLYDIIGTVGVVVILYTYGALHLGKMTSSSLVYSLLNLLGSLAILYSLFYQWNLASFVIEIVWSLMSIYGLCKYYCLKKNG